MGPAGPGAFLPHPKDALGTCTLRGCVHNAKTGAAPLRAASLRSNGTRVARIPVNDDRRAAPEESIEKLPEDPDRVVPAGHGEA